MSLIQRYCPPPQFTPFQTQNRIVLKLRGSALPGVYLLPHVQRPTDPFTH